MLMSRMDVLVCEAQMFIDSSVGLLFAKDVFYFFVHIAAVLRHTEHQADVGTEQSNWQTDLLLSFNCSKAGNVFYEINSMGKK